MTPLRQIDIRIALGYVALYVFLDWISYIYPVAFYGITPWNPPPGLSLALLLIHGLRYAPALWVAAAVADIAVRGMASAPWVVVVLSTILALGYTGIAAALARLLPAAPRIAGLRDLARFSIVVAAGTMAVAACYVAAHSALGLLQWSAFRTSFIRFWTGDLLGVLLTTPLLLAHVSAWPSWRASLRARTGEIALQALVLALALGALYAQREAGAAIHLYILFIPLIWISARHGLRGSTLSLLAVQVGLILVARAAGYSAVTVVELQVFMLILALGTLFLGVAIDERQAVEAQLREKQLELEHALRLAAAAEMASALAHELNQPLSAVSSYLKACELMLANPSPDGVKLRDTMGRASAESRRAADVVRGLREFFRTGTGRLERVALPALVAHAVEPLQGRLHRHRIRLDVAISGSVPPVQVDRLQLEAVLQNLIGNAIDAIVAASARERQIRVELSRPDAQRVQVTVRDSGPGLSPDVANHMFELFRSTKPQGMGLGLALSRTIVEAHGGGLWSEPGGPGAVLRFTLPVAEPDGAAQ